MLPTRPQSTVNKRICHVHDEATPALQLLLAKQPDIATMLTGINKPATGAHEISNIPHPAEHVISLSLQTSNE